MKRKFGEGIFSGLGHAIKKYRNYNRINKSDRVRIFHAVIKIVPIKKEDK